MKINFTEIVNKDKNKKLKILFHMLTYNRILRKKYWSRILLLSDLRLIQIHDDNLSFFCYITHINLKIRSMSTG